MEEMGTDGYQPNDISWFTERILLIIHSHADKLRFNINISSFYIWLNATPHNCVFWQEKPSSTTKLVVMASIPNGFTILW